MESGSEYSPRCSYCGKNLTRNDISGNYECLSCTFQRMDEEDIIDQSTQSSPNFAKQEPEEVSYSEYLQIQRFQEALAASSPQLLVTKILIALNILAYLYVTSKGGSLNNPSREILLEMGANNGEKIFAGEWWRLFTSMFLHGGLMHIAFNMYALWVIGYIVEKLFGGIGYLAIYFVSGLMGGMLSLYNHSSIAVGVGASGAVFGIFGALISYAYFKKMPRKISVGIIKNAGLMILINAAIGLSVPQIDNSAHFGGCVAGIIAAFFIGQDITRVNEKKRKLTSLAVCVVSGILVVSTWGITAEKNRTNEDPRQELIDEINSALARFEKNEKQKYKDLDLLIQKFQKSEITEEDAAKVIENDFIKFFESEGAILKKAIDKKFIQLSLKEYTDEYLKVHLEFLGEFKKFFLTSNENHLQKAKFLREKLIKMESDFFN